MLLLGEPAAIHSILSSICPHQSVSQDMTAVIRGTTILVMILVIVNVEDIMHAATGLKKS